MSDRIYIPLHTRLRKSLSIYRQSILIIFLSIASGFILEIVRFDNVVILGSRINEYQLPILVMMVGVFIAVASFLNIYLGKHDSIQNDNINSNLKDKEYDTILNNLNSSQENIKKEIEELNNKFTLNKKEQFSKKVDMLNSNQQNELVNIIKKKISSETSEEYLSELKKDMNKLISDSTSKRLENHFMRIIKRLSDEINELGKRAKVNLIIGSISALSGVSIFILFVTEKVSPDNIDSYLLTDFAPRISLVIVIEIFAYFFLSLYKNNLSEIKYFHNELTNIDNKYLALEEAIAYSDKKTITKMLEYISQTERNFLLKKGERTVLTDEKDMTLKENKNTIQSLFEILKKK